MSNDYTTQYSKQRNINTLDRGSFNDFGDESPARQVIAKLGGTFNAPLKADTVTVEYPSSTVEIYKFREGGLTGTVLKIVTLTYLAANKKDLSSAELTYSAGSV